jgi:curli biogenesis system outer membrane secretion channel CsgG
MKKIQLFVIQLFAIGFSFCQQTDKTSVGVLDFTSTMSISDEWKNSIQTCVVNGFNTAKRFVVVDRSQLSALNNERNLQKTEDFMNSSVEVKQAQSVGAQYIISGNISSATITSEFKSATTGGEAPRTVSATIYKASFTVQLKVIDVSTGVVENSQIVTGSGSSGFVSGILGTATNGEESKAVAEAMNGLTSNVDKWVGVAFPATFMIAEIQESDPSKGAKKLLLAGGSEFGLTKGERLKVIEETTLSIGGKNTVRKKQIGELKIKEIEGESFSVCSVTDGAMEILNAFNNKSKIYVQTIK